MATYEAGECNIGEAERRKRLVYGIVGVLGAGFVLAGMPPVDGSRALAAVALLWVGYEGLLQYHREFCTGFAHAGVYDITPNGTTRRTVDDPAERKTDRRAAWRIHGLAAAAALVTTAVAVGVVTVV